MPFSKIIYKASAQATPETWMDSTPATAVAADILAPKTALLANGVLTTGTGTGGGSGDTYTRTVIAPLQTVTPNSSRQAELTHTGVFEDGEYYIVTLDGVEWLTSCETLWTNNYVVGEAQLFLGNNFDMVFPFAGATYQGSVEFVFQDTNQHTVKVEHLEFVDGPLNLIEKSITANGTYDPADDDADGYSSVTVNVSGGGSGGLEYETGTYTPASDIARPTISFSKTHTVPPAFVTMSDASENATLAQNDCVYFSLVDSYRFAGSGWPYSASALRNGFVTFAYLGSSVTATNGSILLTYNSDNTGDSTTGYYRYWATETGFKPYANNASRYWRNGRTYKWIAVWGPTT